MKFVLAALLGSSAVSAMKTTDSGPTYTIKYEKTGNADALKYEVKGLKSGAYLAIAIGKPGVDAQADALKF